MRKSSILDTSLDIDQYELKIKVVRVMQLSEQKKKILTIGHLITQQSTAIR
jgi:hypothetical protein